MEDWGKFGAVTVPEDTLQNGANQVDPGTKVLVVIVTYNAEVYIERCLDALLTSTCQIKILVIDNASSDGTVELVKSFSDVLLIKVDNNVGFGRANNIGLNVFLKTRVPYVFLCNQDVYVQPETIQALVEQAEKAKEFDVVGPVQLCGDGSKVDMKFSTYLARLDGMDPSNELALRHAEGVFKIPFINAAAWLMTRRCIEAVGGFDPLFFLYGEDDDFVHRMRYHRLSLGVVPSICVIHDRPQTMEILTKDPSRALRRFVIQDRLRLKDLNRPFWRVACRWILSRPIAYIRMSRTNVKLVWPLMRANANALVSLPAIWKSRRITGQVGRSFLLSSDVAK